MHWKYPSQLAIRGTIHDELRICRDEELIRWTLIEVLLDRCHQARQNLQVKIPIGDKLTHLLNTSPHHLSKSLIDVQIPF